MVKKRKPKQPGTKTTKGQLNSGVSDLAVQAKLAKHAENIRTMSKRVVQDIYGIGGELTEAKKLLGHGHYVDWLEREFKWSVATALNFTRVYEFVEEIKSININFTNLDLSDLDLNIAPSALYALARPNTPEEVRNEMIDRAASGEQVTHQMVKDALAPHKSANGSTPTSATEPTPPAASVTESPPPAIESDDDTGSKSEEQEGEPQAAQDQDPLRSLEFQLRWKVMEARRWFNAARRHAQEAIQYGNPAEKFLDLEVLSYAVGDKDQMEKLCSAYDEGALGYSAGAAKLRRAYAPPMDTPHPPSDATEAKPDDAASPDEAQSAPADPTPDQAS